MWAFGRLLVQASIWWMVKSRGPAAPAEEANVGQITAGTCISLPNLRIKLVHKPQGLGIEEYDDFTRAAQKILFPRKESGFDSWN